MARLVAIVGPSGSGKSTSIEHLDPKETYIINVLDKDPPFHNSKHNYNSELKNYFASESYTQIIDVLKAISEKREDINTIVIDDIGFVMQTEFFNRSSEKGYDKFSEIGQHMFQILRTAKNLRKDLNVVLLFHSEDIYSGQSIVNTKIKTIGRMLDDKYEPAALTTICLYTYFNPDENMYHFVTNKHNIYPAKSPKGMFEEILIPNDLNYVINQIKKYYNE